MATDRTADSTGTGTVRVALPVKATLQRLVYNERGRVARAATVSLEIFNHLGYATRSQLLEGRLTPAECAEIIEQKLLRDGRITSTSQHPPGGSDQAGPQLRSARSRRASSGG